MINRYLPAFIPITSSFDSIDNQIITIVINNCHGTTSHQQSTINNHRLLITIDTQIPTDD